MTWGDGRTISTSPRLGQFASSTSQAAGQVPQPVGMCLMLNLRGSRSALTCGLWFRSAAGTYTETCVAYALLLLMRTELRPGPAGSRTLKSSARMMKDVSVAKVRF